MCFKIFEKRHQRKKGRIFFWFISCWVAYIFPIFPLNNIDLWTWLLILLTFSAFPLQTQKPVAFILYNSYLSLVFTLLIILLLFSVNFLSFRTKFDLSKIRYDLWIIIDSIANSYLLSHIHTHKRFNLLPCLWIALILLSL